MTARLGEIQSKEIETDLTPMIDVAFLIIIFFMCLPFKTLDARLKSYLPTGKGIKIDDVQPPEVFLIKVHVVGRDERERAWGPKDRRIIVQTPTRVLYRFEDGRTTADLDDVGAHIRRMKQAASQLNRGMVRGEIKARPRVPHKFIVAVLNEFAAAEVMDVDFYGSKLPNRRLLNSAVLPYPSR